MSQARDFPLAPLPRRAFLSLLPLLLLPALLLWLSLPDTAVWLSFASLVLTLPLLWVCLFRRRIRLQQGTLHVDAGLNSRRVNIANLDLARARILSPEEAQGYPTLHKTFGTALPGYRAGHFRRRDGQRVFALTSAHARWLLLPEHDGRILLLAAENPNALLQALVTAGKAARPAPLAL